MRVNVALIAVLGPGQALQGECRTQSIAAQTLDAFAIVLVNGHVGVQRKSSQERRTLGPLCGDRLGVASLDAKAGLWMDTA
ncbi:hypothetical protein [Haliangium ochraceum]|uniref:hypothetical protein n=1 Tax=Haliangium ochraceum TaxID=80816 RepID=UPI0005D47B9E|nr:hypothetical protein [Haliangium ochraceum]